MERLAEQQRRIEGLLIQQLELERQRHLEALNRLMEQQHLLEVDAANSFQEELDRQQAFSAPPLRDAQSYQTLSRHQSLNQQTSNTFDTHPQRSLQEHPKAVMPDTSDSQLLAEQSPTREEAAALAAQMQALRQHIEELAAQRVAFEEQAAHFRAEQKAAHAEAKRIDGERRQLKQQLSTVAVQMQEAQERSQQIAAQIEAERLAREEQQRQEEEERLRSSPFDTAQDYSVTKDQVTRKRPHRDHLSIAAQERLIGLLAAQVACQQGLSSAFQPGGSVRPTTLAASMSQRATSAGGSIIALPEPKSLPSQNGGITPVKEPLKPLPPLSVPVSQPVTSVKQRVRRPSYRSSKSVQKTHTIRVVKTPLPHDTKHRQQPKVGSTDIDTTLRTIQRTIAEFQKQALKDGQVAAQLPPPKGAAACKAFQSTSPSSQKDSGDESLLSIHVEEQSTLYTDRRQLAQEGSKAIFDAQHRYFRDDRGGKSPRKPIPGGYHVDAPADTSAARHTSHSLAGGGSSVSVRRTSKVFYQHHCRLAGDMASPPGMSRHAHSLVNGDSSPRRHASSRPHEAKRATPSVQPYVHLPYVIPQPPSRTASGQLSKNNNSGETSHTHAGVASTVRKNGLSSRLHKGGGRNGAEELSTSMESLQRARGAYPLEETGFVPIGVEARPHRTAA